MAIRLGKRKQEYENNKVEEEHTKEELQNTQEISDVKEIPIIEEEPVLAKKDKQIDIEVDSKSKRRKLIISLTWPSLAENFLTSLMSMMDMMMVGGLGAYALSAVGLVTQPKFIMMAAFMAMSVGSTALVARCKGARDPDGANLAFQQSILLTLAMTVVLCVAMIFAAEPLVRWLAGTELSELAITEGLTYFRIQIYGFPTVSLTFAINAALRGAGNTRASFYNNTIANLVNVALNYCLINGRFGFPRMEVAGASLATVIGQTVGLFCAIYTASRGKQYIRLSFKKRWRFDFSMIKRIVRIGFPALIEQVIMRVGMLWFTTIVTGLGELSYSAHMVAMNIMQLSFTTGMAFGTAVTTLVGQCLGRMREDLAKVYVRMTQNMGYFVSAVIALVMFFFGKSLAGLYSDIPEIIILSATMLRIIALSNPVSNARFVYVSALRGAGDSRYMAVISFIGVLLMRPGVSLICVNLLHMGLAGVWIALTSDIVLCYGLSLLRYKRGKWMSIKV